MTEITNNRSTKYTMRARELFVQNGHLTNAELLVLLRQAFPRLSATTVHRITSRMFARGELQLAPSCRNVAMRYDANTEQHDHFVCTNCDVLRDAVFSADVRRGIEQHVDDGCKISGSLTVSGLCKRCKEINK